MEMATGTKQDYECCTKCYTRHLRTHNVFVHCKKNPSLVKLVQSSQRSHLENNLVCVCDETSNVLLYE